MAHNLYLSWHGKHFFVKRAEIIDYSLCTCILQLLYTSESNNVLKIYHHNTRNVLDILGSTDIRDFCYRSVL